jgi:hypothetical protein
VWSPKASLSGRSNLDWNLLKHIRRVGGTRFMNDRQIIDGAVQRHIG